MIRMSSHDPDPWPVDLPSLCSFASIETADDEITLEYDHDIPTTDPKFILSHFLLRTAWLAQRILFPPGSAELTSLTSRSITLRFYLPVVENYTGFFYCLRHTSRNKSDWDRVKPDVARQEEVHFKMADFLNSSEYSQFRCHHQMWISRRWCEARNLVYHNGSFFFLSPGLFEFQEPFLIPGPRTPPLDREEDRIKGDLIVTSNKLSQFPHQLTPVDRSCYVYGTWQNHEVAWYTIFDFMIPLFNTMKRVNATERPADRSITSEV
jgi:hypothetical protein